MALMIDRIDHARSKADALLGGLLPEDVLSERTPAFEITNVADLCYRMDLFSVRDRDIVLDPGKFPNVAPPFRSYWCEWRCPAFLDKDQTIGRFGVWCVITDNTDDETWSILCGLFVSDRKPRIIGRFELRVTRAGQITDPGRLYVFPEGAEFVLGRHERMVSGSDQSGYLKGVEATAAAMSEADRDRFLHAELERAEAKRADANERVQEIRQEMADLVGDQLRIGVLPPLLLAHSLLGCKNVDTENHHPDTKLTRAAVKRRGQALTTFKTLVIRPMGGKHDQGERVSIGGGMTALHLVRGHFKTFTPERPLFGSRVGTYWWSPTARGKAEHGTVVKDYEVRA